MTNRPTAEYTSFDEAYDYFNAKLFEGKLPLALITLNRKSKAYGYFSPERFISRANGSEKVDEIALNPDGFEVRTDEQILSTLVHEMAHLWQQHFGEPPRKCYHDREWADKMQDIGLMPTDTGMSGGKRTGQKVTHYILKDGQFSISAKSLLETGFKLNWQSNVPLEEEKEKKKSKVKYTCEWCGQNAWAKPNASLVCGDCMEKMEGEENAED